MNDAVLVMQAISNGDKYGEKGTENNKITAQGALNADVYEAGGGLSPMDALSIQKYLLGNTKLPESYAQKKTDNITTTTKSNPSSTVTTKTEAKEYFSSSFESGVDSWQGRGDASIELESESYYSGSKSLKVSNRGDYWHGASIALDSSTFKAGNSYSFSAAVLQPTSSALDIKMTLQCQLDGEETYKEVALVNAASKKWTKLENDSFTIPAGATDCILYIEIPESYTDFYIDNVVAASAGTKSSVVTGNGKVGEFKEPRSKSTVISLILTSLSSVSASMTVHHLQTTRES